MMAIRVFVEPDLHKLLDKYIQQREIAGLSREMAKRAALAELQEEADSEISLIESDIIRPTDRYRIAKLLERVPRKS